MAEKKPNGIFESVKTIVYALLIALFIRTVAFEPFNIPSGSMMPTLAIGDYLFVSKYSYGYSKHSLPLSIPLIPGRIFFSEPKRGDVAVFKLPSDNRTDYIKRIVGIPGDKIQMRNGRLQINGKIVNRQKIDNYIIPDNFGQSRRVTKYIETLPNGKAYTIMEMSDQGPLDNTGIYFVPEHHYFAMGDNRDNSQDSRYWGFLPREYIKGEAMLIYWSYDVKSESRSENITSKLKQLFTKPRWERLFHQIH